MYYIRIGLLVEHACVHCEVVRTRSRLVNPSHRSALAFARFSSMPHTNSHALPPLSCIGSQSIGVAELEEVKPGLAKEAMAAGRPVKLIHLTWPSGETIAKVDMTSLEEVVGYPCLGITRHALQHVLLGHLPDDGIQLGFRLEGLDTHEAEGFSELRFEGRPDVVRARAVLGADGRRCDDEVQESSFCIRSLRYFFHFIVRNTSAVSSTD